MHINPRTPPQVAQAKPRNRNKAFANFLKTFASVVCHKDIHRNHPASQNNLPYTSCTRVYFQIMRDSLKTIFFHPSPFITHHSALNAMSLFRIRTQSHGAIPTHCYHFEDSHHHQYSDCLCPRCTTNTVGCQIHAILDCPYSKHLALPLIRKIRTLLYNAG